MGPKCCRIRLEKSKDRSIYRQPRSYTFHQAMRIGYLDCFSGVAGDMWVGALLDAGLDIADLQSAVAELQLPGVSVRAQPVMRCSLAGIRFVVERNGEEIGRAPIELSAATGVGEQAIKQLRPVAPGALVPKSAASAHSHRRLADIVEIIERASTEMITELRSIV